MLKRKYKDKNILVAGMGLSGRSAAKLLMEKGAQVIGYDIRGREELEKDGRVPVKMLPATNPDEVNVREYDLIVTSPGIMRNNKILENAARLGIPVVSEMEVGLSLLPPVKIIAVTGTNGKTTTVKILEFITGGITAGNIGTPLTSIAGKLKKDSLLILEASSYQIPFSLTLIPDVGVLLNIFPEHINWHGGYENYVSDKLFMFRNQSKKDTAVFNNSIKKNSPELIKDLKSRIFFFSHCEIDKGVFLKDGKIFFRDGKSAEALMPVDKYKLRGRHNLDNLMAALLAARLCGIKKFPDISGFTGLPHRLEEVARINGALYINDSKATNMDSLYSAVTSLAGPIILLAGGRSKGSMHPGLKNAASGKIKKIIAFGESREKIKDYFNGIPTVTVPGLKEAVEKSKRSAAGGDTVLLSPGGSSFDEFKDYRDRGIQFKKWVEE